MKKALLDYGTHPSFPAMSVSSKQLNSEIIKASHWLTQRKIEIEQEFEEKAKHLYEMAIDTTRVNESEYNFSPIVGKTYYLYAREDSIEFLSIIEPSQWTVHTQPHSYIGMFKLNSDGIWTQMTSQE